MLPPNGLIGCTLLALLAVTAGCDEGSPRGATAEAVADGQVAVPDRDAGSRIEGLTFTTYAEAIQYVRTNLDCEQDVSFESSFINAAEYCDAGDGGGYLILDLNGREYIYDEVPSRVWSGFQDADSKGSYYNTIIRDRFRLELD